MVLLLFTAIILNVFQFEADAEGKNDNPSIEKIKSEIIQAFETRSIDLLNKISVSNINQIQGLFTNIWNIKLDSIKEYGIQLYSIKNKFENNRSIKKIARVMFARDIGSRQKYWWSPINIEISDDGQFSDITLFNNVFSREVTIKDNIFLTPLSNEFNFRELVDLEINKANGSEISQTLDSLISLGMAPLKRTKIILSEIEIVYKTKKKRLAIVVEDIPVSYKGNKSGWMISSVFQKDEGYNVSYFDSIKNEVDPILSIGSKKNDKQVRESDKNDKGNVSVTKLLNTYSLTVMYHDNDIKGTNYDSPFIRMTFIKNIGLNCIENLQDCQLYFIPATQYYFDERFTQKIDKESKKYIDISIEKKIDGNLNLIVECKKKRIKRVKHYQEDYKIYFDLILFTDDYN